MNVISLTADDRSAKITDLQAKLQEKQDALANAQEAYNAAKENIKKDKHQEMVEKNVAALTAKLGEEIVSLLDLDDNGNAIRSYENVEIVVGHKHDIRLNEFAMEEYIDNQKRGKYNELEVLNECSISLGWRPKEYVNDAISSVAYHNKYHPVKQAVEALTWDGKARCQTFFIDRLGAPDTNLTKELSFKWLFAMIRRVYEPGSIFDHYLILADSTQGTGKTKTLERLTMALGIVGTDSTITANLADKDNIIKLNNCIIGLFDEASATKYGNLEGFKSFVTNSRYLCRMPYDRQVSEFASHCVFALTTNDTTFLTDSTSDYERRAWVLQCNGRQRTEDEWEVLNNDRELRQVWAELYHYYIHPQEAPYNIEANGCTFLAAEQVEELKEIQRGCKTANEDYEIENAIDSVLNGHYSQSIFITPQQFIEDLTSKNQDGTANIDEIPLKWFYGAVNRLLRKNRSEQYIRSIILYNEEWKIVERHRYNSKQCTCLIRKKKLNELVRTSTSSPLWGTTDNDDLLEGCCERPAVSQNFPTLPWSPVI